MRKFNFFPFLVTFYDTVRQIHSLTNKYFIHFTTVTDFDGFVDNHVKYCYNIDSLFITLQLTSLWGKREIGGGVRERQRRDGDGIMLTVDVV